MAFTIVTKETIQSTGVGIIVPNPSGGDYIIVENVTQEAATNPNKAIKTWSYGPNWGIGASAQGQGFKTVKTTFDLTSIIAAGTGFTWVSSVPLVEAQNSAAITSITQADPAVVSQVAHGYSNGDIIQFYNTTGMLQIAGMNFEVSSVAADSYSLIGLDATGFATAATAGNTRRISTYLAVNPQFLYVTKISKATQAVVRTSADPTLYYSVGMKVHFSIPYSFGMTQMNQLTGKIVAMSSAAYTMTVDIDSSTFTTFAFPASTASPTAQLFATVAPAGASTQVDPITGVQTGYNFQYQPFRSGQFVPYIFLAAGSNSPAGSNNDILNIKITKSEN